MLYIMNVEARPTLPRVARIIDMREAARWLDAGELQVSDDVGYIPLSGALEWDSGYAVYTNPEYGDDCLLVTLEDGRRVVTSRTGLEAYVTRTGQVLPADLPR